MMKYSFSEVTAFREEQTSETAGKRKFPKTAREEGPRDGNRFPDGKALKVKSPQVLCSGTWTQGR